MCIILNEKLPHRLIGSGVISRYDLVRESVSLGMALRFHAQAKSSVSCLSLLPADIGVCLCVIMPSVTLP